MSRKPKLLDQVREALRTEQACVNWSKRFILFNSKRHPGEMEATDVCTFLAHLEIEEYVSASTQTQALGELLVPIPPHLECTSERYDHTKD